MDGGDIGRHHEVGAAETAGHRAEGLQCVPFQACGRRVGPRSWNETICPYDDVAATLAAKAKRAKHRPLNFLDQHDDGLHRAIGQREAVPVVAGFAVGQSLLAAGHFADGVVAKKHEMSLGTESYPLMGNT